MQLLTLAAISVGLSTIGVDAICSAVPKVPGYRFAGCYTEATSSRALTGLHVSDELMAIEKCAGACSGFAYFGVENGDQCYCGDTLNAGSVYTKLSECSVPCPADAAHKCGGPDRLVMYIRRRASSSVSSSSVASTSSMASSSIASSSVASSSSVSSSIVSESSNVVPSSIVSPSIPSSSTLSSSIALSSSLSSTIASSTIVSGSSSAVPSSFVSSTIVSSSILSSSTPTPSIVSESSTIPPSSTTTSTISSSSSSSSTSTTAPAAPTSVIVNGDFEKGGAWTVKISAPNAFGYSFFNPTSPRSGFRSGSVTYTGSATAQSWYNQAITLEANKHYNFSGWTKASSANPGCSVNYYIGDTADNVVKIMAQMTSANLKPNWAESTGFYDSPRAGAYTFNIRITCAGAAARTYFMDDLTLTPSS